MTKGQKKSMNLLASLSNGPAKTDMIKDIFHKLDLDGDGTISWWEWKNILRGFVLKEGATSLPPFDRSDSLVVKLLSAHDALRGTGNKPINIFPVNGFDYIGVSSEEISSDAIKYTYGNVINKPAQSPISIVEPVLRIPRPIVTNTNPVDIKEILWKPKNFQEINELKERNVQHRQKLRNMKLSKLRTIFLDAKISFFINKHWLPYMEDLLARQKRKENDKRLEEKEIQDVQDKKQFAVTTMIKSYRGRKTRKYISVYKEVRDVLVEETVLGELNKLCLDWIRKFSFIESLPSFKKNHELNILRKMFLKLFTKCKELGRLQVSSAIRIQCASRARVARIRKKNIMFSRAIVKFNRFVNVKVLNVYYHINRYKANIRAIF